MNMASAVKTVKVTLELDGDEAEDLMHLLYICSYSKERACNNVRDALHDAGVRAWTHARP